MDYGDESDLDVLTGARKKLERIAKSLNRALEPVYKVLDEVKRACRVVQRANMSHKPREARPWCRAWKHTPCNISLMEWVPQNEKQFRDAFGDTAHGRRVVQRVIKFLLAFPENRNCWLAAQRVYVKTADGWTRRDEKSRKEFFPEIRKKIWTKYRLIVMSYMKRNIEMVDKDDFLSWAYNYLKVTKMRWNNQDLEEELKKYRLLLQNEWDRRRK